VHSPGARAHDGPECGPNTNLLRVGAQLEPERLRFERHVVSGLARTPKALSSMYFYDARGSELFRRFMELPEYYVTRVEHEILEQHGARIVAPLLGADCEVVDLGAGDGLKARILLQHFRAAQGAVRYLPVDVSEDALRTVLAVTHKQQPWLPAQGVVADYAGAIAWLGEHDPWRRRLVLLLGSNIGNLARGPARRFFRARRGALRPGDHVLVGFDLIKDVDLLQAAYDDSAGVTAEFNLNLLRRINRELGGDFRLGAFRHFAAFSPVRRAMESYLLSTAAQSVHIAGRSFAFEPWEPIRTEISCKYRVAEVSAFARDAGFVEVTHHCDERRFFVDALWRVPPDIRGPSQ
jgi:dimethylhistidine N-methyltransferase